MHKMEPPKAMIENMGEKFEGFCTIKGVMVVSLITCFISLCALFYAHKSYERADDAYYKANSASSYASDAYYEARNCN